MITAADARLEAHFFQLSIAPKEFNNSEEAMTIFPRACAIKLGVATGFIVALSMAGPAAAGSPKVGDPPEASNMRLVGFNDLQGRSAYQPTIHHQGNRWIAYIGHHGGTDEIPKPVNRITGQPELPESFEPRTMPTKDRLRLHHLRQI